MAAVLHNVASLNGFSTTLDGAITDSDTSATLTSITGLNASGGILVIDRVNASGTNTPSLREYIQYTAIATKTLTGCIRGLASSSAQAHSSGAVIEETYSVTHINDLISFLEVSHASDGTIKSGTTFTDLVVNTSISGTAVLDEDDMASDSTTHIATQQSIKAYADNTNLVTTETSSNAPTPTGSAPHNNHSVTALAVAATVAAPSGTPVNGNKLILRIKDNGTARALTWDSIYSGVLDTLPTTTTISKVLYLGFIYNSTSVKWEYVATMEEA